MRQFKSEAVRESFDKVEGYSLHRLYKVCYFCLSLLCVWWQLVQMVLGSVVQFNSVEGSVWVI